MPNEPDSSGGTVRVDTSINETARMAVMNIGGCGMIYGDRICILDRGHAGRCGPMGPEPVCSVCGTPEEDTAWEHLIDVRVITADNEEGFADVTQLLCDQHFPPVQESLLALGFKDHRHGGIDFLEDETCPGRHKMTDCPTPTEYGRMTVQPTQPGREPEEET